MPCTIAAPEAVPDTLSLTFQALADPTRRAILQALASGERTPTELAAPFAMSLPAVTKHLRILERAGLIARRRQAQRRPCVLQAGPLCEALGWIDRYRAAPAAGPGAGAPPPDALPPPRD